MPLRKRPARTRLQVALEAAGCHRVPELQRDDEGPGTMMDRHAGWSSVEPVQAAHDVACEANVVAIGMRVATKDIDEASRFHAADEARPGPASRNEILTRIQNCPIEEWGFRNRTDVNRLQNLRCGGPPSSAPRTTARQTSTRRGRAQNTAGEAGLDEARRRRAKSGWETGIRTPITASRARCPTVERPPSNGVVRGAEPSIIEKPRRLSKPGLPAPSESAQESA
jgi:hypothetical protein